MPKTTKKVAAKKPVAKKAPTKKTVKKVVKPAAVAKPVVTEIPLPDPYCHCTKRKRNCILTSVFVVSFVLGILTAQFFGFCGCDHHKRAPRLEYVNGCVNVESIKCPKLLESIPMIDADHDGCVTKKEMRAAKKMMRHHRDAEPAVVDAIAPVME